MDFTPVIAQTWGTLGWIILFMLLIGPLKSAWAKGHIGEFLVRLFARWQLDKHIHHRLHNVTLNTPNGTTQIDHVFLSPYRVVVQETKNMSGWIFGGEKQTQWVQRLYKRTFKFQNPLRQNYKHLKALETTLGVSTEHLHSAITFVGGSTLKTEVPTNVTQFIGFIRHINSFKPPVFSEAENDAMLQALQTGHRASTLATHRAHVQNLKRRSYPTANRQCPKCSSALVIRTRKTGANFSQQFWGCSTVPQCKTIQSF
ncbi:nuclease-related domain-containing protein [Pseudomonas sp. ZL2]